MNPYDPRPGQMWPAGGGGGLFGDILGGWGGGGGAQAQMNQAQMNQAQMNAAAYQRYHQQAMGVLAGYTQPWNFAEKPKPEGPEQYGPLRPPAPDYGAWRYETSYASGRENVWLPPLRDPGGRLLKAAAILGAYPAVYLVVLLLRGLLYAIL